MSGVEAQRAKWLKEGLFGGYQSFGRELQTVRLWREEGKPCQWTLILGDNGTGKSTLLRALGRLSSLQFPVMLGERPQPMDSYLAEWGEVYGRFWGDLDLRATNNQIMVAGYGPYRSESEGSDKTREGASDSGLSHLDYGGRLRNPVEYLVRSEFAQSKGSKVDFSELVVRALPDHPRVELRESGSRHFADYDVIFHMPTGPTPFQSLGQGYIAQITYLIDFASRMVEAHEDMENPFEGPAICLIDEIDLHMHPKWQRQIIRHLSETFPNTQFIATAHSPLIVQGAEDANLVLLRRPEQPDADGNRFTIIDNDIDYVTGWRLDQLITSDLFGIDSPRSVETAAKIDEQRSLLKSMARSEEEDARLAALNQELDKLPPGDTAEQARAVMELAEKMRQTLDLFDAKKEQ